MPTTYPNTFPPSSTGKLPFELCDIIIKFAREEEGALERFSMVSLQWAHMAHKYMFETVNLWTCDAITSESMRLLTLRANVGSSHSTSSGSLTSSSSTTPSRSPSPAPWKDLTGNTSSFIKLLESDKVTFLGKIRSVCFDEGRRVTSSGHGPSEMSWKDVLPLLEAKETAQWQRVRTLRLINVDLSQETSPKTCTLFPNVSHLRLDGPRVKEGEQFIEFISSFNSLRSLEVSIPESEMYQLSLSPSTQFIFPPQLQLLQLHLYVKDVAWFAKQTLSPWTVCEISLVDLVHEWDVPSFMEILRVFTPCLQRLTIDLAGVRRYKFPESE